MTSINCEECNMPLVVFNECVAKEPFTVECGLPECHLDVDFGTHEALETCGNCLGVILYCNECWYTLTGEIVTREDVINDSN